MAFEMPRLIAPTAEHVTKLPPLSDDEVRACEAKFGVRFPGALIDLLKEQNGGYFENSDFKLNGKDFRLDEVMGLSSSASWSCIQPLDRILEPDYFLEEERAQIQEVIGDAGRVFAFGGDGHFFYVLDYNRLNKAGEPTVAYIDIEGAVAHRTVADSFAELLAAQYEGDGEPAVNLAEANELVVLAAGGYAGTRPNAAGPLEHSWKICGSGDRIIVLASENFGFGATLNRYELAVSALALGEFDGIATAAELGPELAELVLPALTKSLIEEWVPDVSPACHQLRLPIDPQKEWVQIRTSAPYGGKWKNTETEVVYAAVYSGSQHELKKALLAVIAYSG